MDTMDTTKLSDRVEIQTTQLTDGSTQIVVWLRTDASRRWTRSNIRRSVYFSLAPGLSDDEARIRAHAVANALHQAASLAEFIGLSA
jgi:hypothetical protein